VKVLLGILVVVLVLIMPVGQTQANANQPINGEVAVANVASLTSTPQITETTQATPARTTAAEQAEQKINQTTQANPAVDEAEQANTAEAWNHRMASEVDRGEAPMINAAGIFTASFNDAIENADNQNNLGTREGNVIKTFTAGADVSPRANENTTNIADVHLTALRA
jgi:hypothetical protein